MKPAPRFLRRLCLAVDLRSYSRHTPDEQFDGQARLVRILEHAVRRSRVPKVLVQRQDQGDGRLLVLPLRKNELHVVPALILGLRDGLYQMNLFPTLYGRLQLRAALGQGLLTRSHAGYVGECVVTTSRLLDAGNVRDALTDEGPNDLSLAVTPELYREVICREAPGLPSHQFREIDVDLPKKDFHSRAWLYTPRSAPVRELGVAPLRLSLQSNGSSAKDYVIPALTAAHVAVGVATLFTQLSAAQEWQVDADDPASDRHDQSDPGPGDQNQNEHPHDHPGLGEQPESGQHHAAGHHDESGHHPDPGRTVEHHVEHFAHRPGGFDHHPESANDHPAHHAIDDPHHSEHDHGYGIDPADHGTHDDHHFSLDPGGEIHDPYY